MATRVQTKANDAASASTIDAAMDSNVTSGNKLVALCKYNVDFTPAASMISDTLNGDAWTLDWSLASLEAGVTTVSDYAVFSKTFSTGGACTVTFNPAGSAARIGIAVREYSGLGAHGGSIRNSTHILTNGTPTSGGFTPSEATGVIFAFVSSSQVQTWESGYNDATADTNGGRFYTAVDESVTAEAQSADTTQTSAAHDMGALWYPDAAAGHFGPMFRGS